MPHEELDKDDSWSLLQHPFIIDSVKCSRVCKTETGYSLHFNNSSLSKSIPSVLEKGKKKYIVLEISENICHFLCEIDNLHIFREPSDFYLPNNPESEDFYESLYNNVMNSDINTLCEFAEEVDKEVRNNGFPQFVLPRVSTAKHFGNFDGVVANTKTLEKVYCKKIQFGEEVPSNASPESIRIQKVRLGDVGFKIQNDFFGKLFAEKPIWRFLEIFEKHTSLLSDYEKEHFKKFHLKTSLSLHAYFYSSGPWRGLWVMHGYDPSFDSSNYKYQIVAFERNKPIFQVFQLPKVIEEVSTNPSWYLRKECDPIIGFFSESLKKLIQLVIDEIKNSS